MDQKVYNFTDARAHGGFREIIEYLSSPDMRRGEGTNAECIENRTSIGGAAFLLQACS
jgi:hypothetical protein